MGLRDRLDQLRKGPGAAQPDQYKPTEKRQRVGPITYFKQMREELSKVSWPKRRAVVRGTVQVLIVSAIFVVILGAADLGLQTGLEKLIKSDEPATPVETVPAESVPTEVPSDVVNVTQ